MTPFLILFCACWIAAFVGIRKIVPEAVRRRHRSSVFWGQIALFSVLMLLTASWSRWDLVNWISGRKTEDVSVVEASVALLVISSILALVFLAAEGRGRKQTRLKKEG